MDVPSPHTRRRDCALAVLVAALLTAAWCVQHWVRLTLLDLPDTDDLMRLQQVRDWLGGQAWGDLRQYRLGPNGGMAMHWSRLADLPLAALIALLRPLLGQPVAELVAVIAWPATLFAAQLALVAAITRRLGHPAAAPVAIIVAALAYPATSLFMPGRIDHHALQFVLLTACVHGLVAPPSRLRGIAIGAAMVASVAIGFETLPLIVVLGGWAVVGWLRGGDDGRLLGIGAGVALTGVLAGGLIPASAPVGLCDALDPVLRDALVIAGFALVVTVAIARRYSPAVRGGALVVAVIPVALALSRAPACLSGPYGAVDPLLARLWLAQVVEARPLFAAPPDHAIGYAGLAIAGLAATLWRARRDGGAWWGMAALIAAALGIALVQLRGAYAGAVLAAPGLALLIGAARARGSLSLAGAWIVSAGVLYPLAGAALVPDQPAGPGCDRSEMIAALRGLPAGRVAAPIDLGATVIAHTAHASLAAPYHRNNAGNGAMYRLFLVGNAQARAIALREGVDYVAWCASGFGSGALPAATDSLVRRLPRQPPGWLIAVPGGDGIVWRVDRGLPDDAAPL